MSGQEQWNGSAVVPASALPFVTAARMAEVDRLAMDGFGITLPQMMEQAGSHLAETVRRLVGRPLGGCRVVVAVGPGSNGGGGLAGARHLANRGADVRVILARPARRLSEPARHQLATLLAMGTSCCVATYDLPDDELRDVLTGADIVVDSILGYGTMGAPRAEIGHLIELVLDSASPVLSLDVPSGIDPDTGEAPGLAVVAMATLTLALPKAGLLSGHGTSRVGRLFLADIGLPASLYARLDIAVGVPFAADRVVEIDRTA